MIAERYAAPNAAGLELRTCLTEAVEYLERYKLMTKEQRDRYHRALSQPASEDIGAGTSHGGKSDEFGNEPIMDYETAKAFRQAVRLDLAAVAQPVGETA